ncbi:MAG: retropepsin-like aspartic protease [Proteobacteria bacterium]|nr:retropepsin-like aspartic protease [Pseudomonadota bacterium]
MPENGNWLHVRNVCKVESLQRGGKRNVSKSLHHTLTILLFLSAGAGLWPADAGAADVNLNGIVGNKALLVIDGGKPRWLAIGETSPEGIKLVSISGETAVFELGGKKQTVKLGQNERLTSGGGSASSGSQSVSLNADGSGHFIANGQINGRSVRFLVDTGATFILLGSEEARSLGINYLAGQKAAMSTANGVVPAYRVKLDEVRLGDISLNNVDGVVTSGSQPIVLLGMSFLNRMEMKRDGETMTLKKRF